jgi:endoglucanase
MNHKMMVYGLLFLSAFSGCLAASPILGDIKIDHFGYRTTDTKTAYFTANPGAGVSVVNAATNTPVYAVTTITSKGTDPTNPQISGDTLWWADFSAFTTPGTYYIFSSSLNEQSYNFQISDTIYQAPVTAALKSLYYARCGTAKTAANGGVWNDTACHTSDAACTAICATSGSYSSTINFNYGTLNLEGGWHDAGDYEKKIGPGTSCGVIETGDNGDTLWYLLTAYEINPGLFPANQINLPESGDGIPDILNQAKWELDWYLKMQMTDGHVLEGVHVTNLGTLASPPSADTTPRGYMPPSYESEAVFVASAAHAARIFAAIPAGASYAATLRAAAELTWNDWVLNSPTTVSALSYLPYGEFKVWAASEMFRMETALGGSAAILSGAKSVVDNYTTWSSYFVNPSEPYSDWAIFNYLQTTGATTSTVTGMQTALSSYVNNLFGQNDLYNSGIYSWQYSWGSNQIKACAGLELYFAGMLGDTGSYTTAQCLSHAEDFLHYFHGANPLNMVYLTNTDSMGAKHCVWQVFNTWFGSYGTASSKSNYIGKPAAVTDPLYPYFSGTDNFGISDNNTSNYGPPPGYVPDGPTFQYSTSGGQAVPPLLSGGVQAPYEKSYRDWNYSDPTGTKTIPWLVNEAGIYDTSSYMALSSLFAGKTYVAAAPTATPTPTAAASTVTPTVTPTLSSTVVISNPFPNPSSGAPVTFNIQTPDESRVTMDVFTLAFRKITSQTAQVYGSQNFLWDLTDLSKTLVANGLYYVRIRIEGNSSAVKILKVLVLR